MAGLSLFHGHLAYAIDPHRAISQYVQDHWGAEQGFPSGSVYSITQTSDGYLWIGTEAGLLRFDGLQFRLMRGQSGTYPVTSVLGLAPDKDGSLWVRLRDMTLLRYRVGEFEDPFSRAGPIANFTAMGGTNQGELLTARMQQGAFSYRSGGLTRIAAATGLPRSPIIAITQAGDGAIWMGTRSAGLIKLEGGGTTVITKGLPDPKVNCLLPNGAAGLWIGTDSGLARWTGSEITTRGIPRALTGVQILSLSQDRDANLWVGTDSGKILRFNTDGVAALERGDEARAAVTTLFEDRESNLWFGSANGLGRLRDSAFVTYSTPEGLPTDGSNPVFADSENRTWFAPATGGLWWFKGDQHGSVTDDGLGQDIVYSIAGSKDDLWVGRQRGGLTHIHIGQGRFRTESYKRENGLAQNSVYSVYPGRSGVVWAGTLSAGVSRLEGRAFKTYTMADGLASNTVAAILEAADGTVWFATPGGLSALARGKFRTFTSREGLPSGNVNCLLQDSKGVIWAGTTAGIAFGNAGRFQVPARVPVPLKRQVLGLAEDKFGSIWAATSNGVLQINRTKLLNGDAGKGDWKTYGLADGLRGTAGVKRDRSVYASPSGRIWFSLNQGISVVDPARLTRRSAAAIAHIESISADGSRLPASGTVLVPAGRQRVVFRYAGLGLSVPQRVRFRYRLEGFDRGWSEPGAEREAVYTNLSPGPYRFRVMAANAEGSWNPQEAALSFAVDPAYWQTWWFRAGLALTFAFAAFVLYRLRLRNLTERLNIRFEERLAERTRIAQELHDTLLQGFISASMQVHVVADRLRGDSQLKAPLARSLEVMRQVIEEGRNAVRGLRYSNSASMDLESAFALVQNEFMTGDQSARPPDFRVISEGARGALHPVLRDEVYRIGREALINAFRHARAKTIEMELNYSPGALRILVRDDGCGMDPELLQDGRDGHWGLLGIRERADRIGARLRLWSSVNNGTEVELWVPGHIAYLRDSKLKAPEDSGKYERTRSTGNE